MAGRPEKFRVHAEIADNTLFFIINTQKWRRSLKLRLLAEIEAWPFKRDWREKNSGRNFGARRKSCLKKVEQDLMLRAWKMRISVKIYNKIYKFKGVILLELVQPLRILVAPMA